MGCIYFRWHPVTATGLLLDRSYMVDGHRVLLGIYGKVRRIMSAEIPTCGDDCGLISKSTPILVAVYCAQYNFTDTETFECGGCYNKDSWTIPEMLWHETNKFLITPCCHTEAIAALVPSEPKEEYDQRADDMQSYVWAVTGR